MIESRPRYALYIVETGQRSFYTGISTDTAKRFGQHRRGVGARFLRDKRDLRLVYQSDGFMCGSCAVRVERLVKRMSKARKLKLIDGRITIGQCMRFECRRHLQCSAAATAPPTASR